MFVSIFLLVIPFLATLSSVFIYRLRGKKRVFSLDLMQFMYAFVFSVIAFVWIKTFLFTLLRTELGITISVSQLFVFDTLISVIFLYVYAFIVMHSLTTSFRIQVDQDPLFDIFHNSEYIHLWLSHIASYAGLMLLIIVLAVANVFFPLQLAVTRVYALIPAGIGVLGGILAFMGVMLANPMQKRRLSFTRLMKLIFGFCFTILAGVYFVMEPAFELRFGFYWFSVFVYATTVFLTLYVRRSRKARNILEKIVGLVQHEEWGDNIDLFAKSHKKSRVGLNSISRK